MSLHERLAECIETGVVKPCPKCKETGGLWPEARADMHEANIRCANCDNRHCGYLPKHPTPKTTRRDGRKAGLLDALRAHYDPEPLYCWICLADERTFPTGVWLEAHHILEHQDGGTDDPANLQPLCNECHALVHWRRKTTRARQVGKEREHA